MPVSGLATLPVTVPTPRPDTTHRKKHDLCNDTSAQPSPTLIITGAAIVGAIIGLTLGEALTRI